MSYNSAFGVALVLIATFIAAVSQIMLKLSTRRSYTSQLAEYLNLLVIGGYILLLGTTLINVIALRFIPITLATALESTGQIFVQILSFIILKESVNKRKLIGIFVIIFGLIVYFL